MEKAGASMQPGYDFDTSPEQNKPPTGPITKVGQKRFFNSRSRLLLEIASVLVVLSVAIYFILGASAKGPGATGSTTLNPTAASTAGLTPSPTGTQVISLPTNLPKLQVLSVTPNNSTVKITFKPVAGAKDYRAFDVLEPKVVKYAGMAHLEGGPFQMNADGTPVFPITASSNGSGPRT